MNVNILSIPDPTLSNGVLCNRAKIDTGTHCNYNCFFCYYSSKLNEVTPFEIIKDRIDYVKSQNITEVDLSGGEPSIHRDWFKILDYCRDNNLKISCLSNGSMFSDYNFIKKSKEHGLREILFSLHGYNQLTHDDIVQRKGAFDKIIKAINNAKELGIIVRINCTVQEKNYIHIANEYATLINNIDPLEINFITLNKWSDTGIALNDYSMVTREIKKAIGKLNTKYINVRYTPFCYMKGFEKYICGHHQHIYDVYDWNTAVYEYKLSNTKENMFKEADKIRLIEYTKPPECLKCKFFKICDGVDGDIPVYPEAGEHIQDVNYFRTNFYDG